MKKIYCMLYVLLIDGYWIDFELVTEIPIHYNSLCVEEALLLYK